MSPLTVRPVTHHGAAPSHRAPTTTPQLLWVEERGKMVASIEVLPVEGLQGAEAAYRGIPTSAGPDLYVKDVYVRPGFGRLLRGLRRQLPGYRTLYAYRWKSPASWWVRLRQRIHAWRFACGFQDPHCLRLNKGLGCICGKSKKSPLTALASPLAFGIGKAQESDKNSTQKAANRSDDLARQAQQQAQAQAEKQKAEADAAAAQQQARAQALGEQVQSQILGATRMSPQEQALRGATLTQIMSRAQQPGESLYAAQGPASAALGQQILGRLNQPGESLYAAQGPASAATAQQILSRVQNPGQAYTDTTALQTQRALESLFQTFNARGISPQSPIVAEEGRREARDVAIQNAVNRLQAMNTDIGFGQQFGQQAGGLEATARQEGQLFGQQAGSLEAIARQEGQGIGEAAVGRQAQGGVVGAQTLGDIAGAGLGRQTALTGLGLGQQAGLAGQGLSNQFLQQMQGYQNELSMRGAGRAALGQTIGTLGGAAGGFALSGGNPMGAMYGAQLGGGLGGGGGSSGGSSGGNSWANPLMLAMMAQGGMGGGYGGGYGSFLNPARTGDFSPIDQWGNPTGGKQNWRQ